MESVDLTLFAIGTFCFFGLFSAYRVFIQDRDITPCSLSQSVTYKKSFQPSEYRTTFEEMLGKNKDNLSAPLKLAYLKSLGSANGGLVDDARRDPQLGYVPVGRF